LIEQKEMGGHEMITIIEGDITKTDKDIIVQQVNARGFMASGLAKTIMQRYDNVKKEYQAFRKKQLKTVKTDENLLGSVNYVDVYDGKIIANVFGQVDIREDIYDKKVYTDKKALLHGIEQVKIKAEELKLSVAIPTYIGCGLANGSWEEIKPGIEMIFENSTVDVVFYHYR
jgi:O-acetyl-ADP-ribose deacetylase (regulator of RNase III)